MANSLVNNPWVVDSATNCTTEIIRVKGIRWVNATTAGHQAIIKDANANVIWASIASGANYVEADTIYPNSRGANYRGFNVTSLASGTLYIELL